ncbi:MAG: hypothetical protein JW867_08240 [Candidatus Omnitrophica bacterium]|nr:hypothetical protein [Candidatus Omnitrophota bacterium]
MKNKTIIRISKNRLLDALFKLMLFSAIVHMFIVFLVALVRRDLSHLNYFKIIGVDIFIPYVEQGLPSQFASVSVAAMLYGIIFFFFTKD